MRTRDIEWMGTTRSLVQTHDGLSMTFYYRVTDARGLSLVPCIVCCNVLVAWTSQNDDLAFISNLPYCYFNNISSNCKADVSFFTEPLLIMNRVVHCFTIGRGRRADSHFSQQRQNKSDFIQEVILKGINKKRN